MSFSELRLSSFFFCTRVSNVSNFFLFHSRVSRLQSHETKTIKNLRAKNGLSFCKNFPSLKNRVEKVTSVFLLKNDPLTKINFHSIRNFFDILESLVWKLLKQFFTYLHLSLEQPDIDYSYQATQCRSSWRCKIVLKNYLFATKMSRKQWKFVVSNIYFNFSALMQENLHAKKFLCKQAQNFFLPHMLHKGILIGANDRKITKIFVKMSHIQLIIEFLQQCQRNGKLLTKFKCIIF